MSSLAAQLAHSASLNSALLADRSKRKPVESYLFTGREAGQHDLESIHALAMNGFLQLSTIDPSFRKYEGDIFSERAKVTDRTLLSQEDNDNLNKAIHGFLLLLGPYLMDSPTGRVLEWLVRRFRINEFNLESLLALFLPYHESPHFAKMVTILHIKNNSPWTFLVPYKSAAQSLPRVSLVTEMLRNSDVARFVVSLLPLSIKEGQMHRTLLAFNAATIHEYLQRSKSLNEGTVAYLLPALLEPLQGAAQEISKDSILGSYILLSAFCHRCELTKSAVKAIVNAMSQCANNAAVAVCENQPDLEWFPEKTAKAILHLQNIKKELQLATSWVGSEAFLLPMEYEEEPFLIIESLIRKPEVLNEAVHNAGREDEGTKEKIERLIMSLNTVTKVSSQSGSVNVDVILASSDADAKVRTLAVKELTKSLANSDTLLDGDIEFIQAALLARIADTSIQVLEALYDSEIVTTAVFKKDMSSYILALSHATLSVLNPNVRFSVESTDAEQIFHDIIFPFLLFSKPRQHTAELVWDLVDEHVTGPSYEWLSGCSTIVKEERSKHGSNPLEQMNAINIAFSEKIAHNILKSNTFKAQVDHLILKLYAENPHSRSLGYLIARSLISQLSGEHQIDVADRVLAVMKLDSISGIEDISAEKDTMDRLDDHFIGINVVAKPSSKTTLTWLQLSIIRAICSIPQPDSLVLAWFTVSATSPDNRGNRYVGLVRSIYQLANTPATLPTLSTTLLGSLFVSLKNDALAFLASIWSKVDGEYQDKADIRGIALRHGAAFLEAYILEDNGVDFQTILPSLLVPLQSRDSSIQQAALECLSRLRVLAERKFKSVYKFDIIYGEKEDNLQYLDVEDQKWYLNAVLEHRDHFMHDAKYLVSFHEQYLKRSKSDKKRISEYKHRVLCCLLTHITALPMQKSQCQLLESLSTVTDQAKAQILLPAIRSVAASPISDSNSEQYASMLLSSFNSSVAVPLWNVFVSALRTYFKPDTSGVLQSVLARSLQKGLFENLSKERQIELCEILIELGISDPQTHIACKKLISSVLQDIVVIFHLLDTSPRAKRIKASSASEDALSRLGLLLEVLVTKTLPASLDLVSHLLETLNRVVQVVSLNQTEISYVEQLLMIDVSSRPSSAIRLDILVELIRVANNPQTFHQALLLMAKLARLAPESVLHNIMPVFTFMGSNVFHRDDAYSFRVVQQTIDGIVPVMVDSLKKSRTQSLDLYIASKEFLRVFTDAANHIPRHRRNNFFAHLIDVLGVNDFLAPASSRVSRQNTRDVQNTLSLPISILQSKALTVQVLALVEVLSESQRLVSRILSHDESQPVFLDGASETEHTAPWATVVKRRTQALIIFVGHALKTASNPSESTMLRPMISTMVSQLVKLATLKGSDVRVEDISQTAQASLNRLLAIMSAADFVQSILTMLEANDIRVQIGALELLRDRLPDVAEKTRRAVTSSVVKIIQSIKNIVAKHNGNLGAAAFQALKSITITMASGEENTITEIIPFALVALRSEDTSHSALAALTPMPSQLGPRIIPFFREIIVQAISTIRDNKASNSDDAFSLIHGLLASIPTFWGAGELNQLIELYIEYPASGAMSTLMKAMSKKIPAKVLLPSSMQAWTSKPTTNANRISAYFEFFLRVLRNTPRPVIQEHLRGIFKVVFDSLDLLRANYSQGDTGEVQVIRAFRELVVKLNETVFRPLFRRLYDWAFTNEEDEIARKILFCHLYRDLLDFFKGLMNPYMTLLLPPFTEILGAFSKTSINDPLLWTCVLEILVKSLSVDDGAFWRDDKLRQIATAAVEQVPVAVRILDDAGKTLLQECFAFLVDTAMDDTISKGINLNILMHTRSEDSRLRLTALNCSEALWRSQGAKLLGFVPETITFITECSEDDNDMIVRESFRLKDAVESVAGKIDGL
ncbi:hypothetical protein BDQ17DRAFT_1360346 [Cyathus striatus]|nr:hypothetical protein BDQ17DRAFT_1360346 [Cyathus striatus]